MRETFETMQSQRTRSSQHSVLHDAAEFVVKDESVNRLPKAPLPVEIIEFARQLRRTQTEAESLLWYLLRSRRLHGMKFRRQHPHPPYTLDFYCHELALAVELDGSQHLESARDTRRDAALNADGIEVLRYWNHDVLARTDGVLEDLWHRIEERISHVSLTPGPSPGRRGGMK